MPIAGGELRITSDDILKDETQPDEIVFVGGGVIALEFGHIYARAGTKITILEAAAQLLPRHDGDAVAVLRAESERIGIIIKADVKVQGINQSGDRLSAAFEHDGLIHILTADRIVNGAGRIANVAGLDLGVVGSNLTVLR